MFKKSIVFVLIILISGFASFGFIQAQDDLPIAEADFLNAELLVAYCFDGMENYYAFLNTETEEEEFDVLVNDAGISEEAALTFMTDFAALSEELGADVDVVTAKSYVYALIIVSCFGEEAVATVSEATDPDYYIIYFELDEEAAAYFYYLYEDTYYYYSIEAYLIDMGIDPAYFNEIFFLLDDQEALVAYFAEIGIEIDIEVFYADLDVLETDAEDDYTEDEAYVEEDEDSDDDGIADEEDTDDDGDGVDDEEDDAGEEEDGDSDDDGIADEEDEDDDGDGVSDEEDEDDDGDGDEDDGDSDEDGVDDEEDLDDDGDGVDDEEDTDDDGDGTSDEEEDAGEDDGGEDDGE